MSVPHNCPNRSRRAPPKIEDPGWHANAVALEQADRLTAPTHRGAINATARRMRVQDAKPRVLAEVGHAETDRLVVPSLPVVDRIFGNPNPCAQRDLAPTHPIVRTMRQRPSTTMSGF